jgi:hypothetical protein
MAISVSFADETIDFTPRSNCAGATHASLPQPARGLKTLAIPAIAVTPPPLASKPAAAALSPATRAAGLLANSRSVAGPLCARSCREAVHLA